MTNLQVSTRGYLYLELRQVNSLCRHHHPPQNEASLTKVGFSTNLPIYIVEMLTTHKQCSHPECPSMDEKNENMVYMHNWVLVSHKGQYIIFRKVYGTRYQHIKQNKSDPER